jgi:SAM-dependent methyltransferase
MEYVPEPAAQIREFARVLRDDGLIVMTVPNPSHPRRVIERPLRAKARTSLVRMLLPLLPEQLAAYFGYLALSINHFPLCAWSSNLRDAGLRIDQVTDLKSPLLTIVARKVNTASE